MSLTSWVQSVLQVGVSYRRSKTPALRTASQTQPCSIKQVVSSLISKGILKDINFERNKVHLVTVPPENRPYVGNRDDQIFLKPGEHEETISRCASLLKDGYAVGINVGHIQETPLGSGGYTICQGIFKIDQGLRLSEDTVNEISSRVGADFHFDMEATAKQNSHNHHYNFYIVLAPKGKLQIGK